MPSFAIKSIAAALESDHARRWLLGGGDKAGAQRRGISLYQHDAAAVQARTLSPGTLNASSSTSWSRTCSVKCARSSVSDESVHQLAGHVSPKFLSRYAHIRAHAWCAAIAGLRPALNGSKQADFEGWRTKDGAQCVDPDEPLFNWNRKTEVLHSPSLRIEPKGLAVDSALGMVATPATIRISLPLTAGFSLAGWPAVRGATSEIHFRRIRTDYLLSPYARARV